MKLNKKQKEKIIPIKFIDEWMLEQFKPSASNHNRRHMILRNNFKQMLFDTKNNSEIIFDKSEISQEDIDEEKKYSLTRRFYGSLQRLNKKGFIEKDIMIPDLYHASDKHLYMELLNRSLSIIENKCDSIDSLEFLKEAELLISKI